MSTEISIIVGDISNYEAVKISAPEYKNGKHNEAADLRNSMENAMRKVLLAGGKRIIISAKELEDKGFPLRIASDLVIQSIDSFTKENKNAFEEIVIVCSSENSRKVYEEELTMRNDGYYDSIDPLSKKDEILKLLSPYIPLVFTNTDEGYDYLEDGCSIVIRDELEKDILYVDLEGEITLGFSDWHAHYSPYQMDYNAFLKDLNSILSDERCLVYITCNGEWMGDFLIKSDKLDKEYVRNQARTVLAHPDFADKIRQYGYSIECRFWDKSKDIAFHFAPEEQNAVNQRM